MPKAVDVNLDAEEMVLKLEKESSPRRIEYSKLDRLVKVKEPVKKLFRTIEVKGLQVHIKGMEEPVIISSDKVGDYDNIEEYLIKVAEKYEVAVEQ
ncbi:hypothetical protein GE107_04645 [Cohnella sp. CFH 77786]|uniref:hypothetical protein n=1 Tax=Cohnella sp. CFH 77786 TaxID=2662265 RepID=UPI001C60D1CF|nr:hypothetical protein [Cohnella sp. CFH 77786]MBW5445349.1 hypothetical protein [Cohnella sp. CFH 77786]